MKEYKIIKSDFHWKNNMEKFETMLNEYAKEGWNVVGYSSIGDSGASFTALLERSKHR